METVKEMEKKTDGASVADFHYTGEKAWCPGCGDFAILTSLEKALAKLGRRPHEVMVVSGIGQAAKLPHYIRTNGFNGLHGRALSPAFGAKVANHGLDVIVTSGDGDIYGEGGNHFLHNIRRNIDITVIVHDNQVYGLTKGQASPTSDLGMVTKTQPGGVVSTPFSPLGIAILLGAPFVARTFSKEIDFTADLIVEAVNTPGFSLIDVLQPCVSFNKLNTYEWYARRAYRLDDGYDPSDRDAALRKAQEWGERIPIGVIYKRPSAVSYLDNFVKKDDPPLAGREPDMEKLEEMLERFY